MDAVLPFRHISLLPTLQSFPSTGFALQAGTRCGNVFARCSEVGTLLFHLLPHGLIVLGQVVQEFAQMLFGFGVIGVVRATADGACCSFLQLSAKAHDVLRTAERVGGGDMGECFLSRLQFQGQPVASLQVASQFVLFAFAERLLLVKGSIALRNMFPNDSGAFQCI